ncbi:MAG: hypothetical protein PHI86_05890 [Candidatus Omnitrophica bacterium]|nr:hypothetical protein [Candidatus Omnitrophota bacterium]
MRAEFFSGSINWDKRHNVLISDETCIPKASVASGDVIAESHAFQNGVDRLENRPFTENSMLVERYVRRKDGELVDWACVLYPEMADETRSALEEIIKDNSEGVQAGINLHKQIYRQLPKLKVLKGGRIELGIGSTKLVISKPQEEQPCQDQKRLPAVFAVPFTSANFPPEVKSIGNYLASTNFTINKPIEEIDENLQELIQSGLFTEKGVRSFVNIQFNIDKI